MNNSDFINTRLSANKAQFSLVLSALGKAAKDSDSMSKRYVALTSVLYFGLTHFFLTLGVKWSATSVKAYLDALYQSQGMSRGSGGKKGKKVPQTVTRFAQTMILGAELGVPLLPCGEASIDVTGEIALADEESVYAQYRAKVNDAKPETASEYLTRAIAAIRNAKGFGADEDDKKSDKDDKTMQFAAMLLAEFGVTIPDKVADADENEVETEFEFEMVA